LALMRRYMDIHEVVEIGFNAGHSSYLFLSARPDVRVLSFDLGDHDYIDMTKGLIDRLFPGRHELIKGDSTKTVPAFADANPDRTFDLIYIDGGHDYEVAKADLEHCRRLSTAASLLVMDDLEPDHEWGAGPARAWREAKDASLIEEILLVEDGFPLAGLTLDDVRSQAVVWGLGRYHHPE
ncbi:MAG: class I SAM-dependent methyltransferase, partial [Acidimicrobiales bacterium]